MSSSTEIVIPSGGKVELLARFSKEISDIPEKSELNIRAGHVQFLRPTCMIMLAKACRARGRRCADETLTYHGFCSPHEPPPKPL